MGPETPLLHLGCKHSASNRVEIIASNREQGLGHRCPVNENLRARVIRLTPQLESKARGVGVAHLAGESRLPKGIPQSSDGHQPDSDAEGDNGGKLLPVVTATLHWKLPLRWRLALARATSTPSPPSSPAASTRPTAKPGSRPRLRRPLPAPRRAPRSRRPDPRAASHTPPAPRPRGAKRGGGREGTHLSGRRGGGGDQAWGRGRAPARARHLPLPAARAQGARPGRREERPRGVCGRHRRRPLAAGTGSARATGPLKDSPETQRSPRERGPERRRPDGGGSLSEEFMGKESRLWQSDGEKPRGVFGD